MLRITFSRLKVGFILIPFEGRVVAGRPGQLDPRACLHTHPNLGCLKTKKGAPYYQPGLLRVVG